MKAKDAEEYTLAVGQTAAGTWRHIAIAERLGVPKALGLTLKQWVEERLRGYVRLSLKERAEAVKELIDEGLSQRAAARALGISKGTVQNDLARTDGQNCPLVHHEAARIVTVTDDTGQNCPPVQFHISAELLADARLVCVQDALGVTDDEWIEMLFKDSTMKDCKIFISEVGIV